MNPKQLLALLLIFFSALSTHAQQPSLRLITGIVKDEKGNFLPAITVSEKSTSNAVVTNDKGAFSIRVRENALLVLSGVGFEPQIIQTGKQTTFNVVLKDDVKNLNDVVVIGYGAQKKAKVIGSVTTIKMDNVLGDRPVSNVASLLAAQVPGLQVNISSGQPTSSPSLNVRGGTDFSTANAFQSTAPLIVVNDVPYEGSLSLLDPNDIETVTVLKDAGSAAIYGARSAYGVILITTKTGKKNQKPQFSYSNNF